MPKTFYITTPLYYVNAPPHLGGTYATIAGDTCCGTDEHGQKIERAAKKLGIPPKELADRVYTQYVDLWKLMGIEYDEFIRPTEPRHHASVIELYTRCKANGHIYKGSYSGWYCVSCEAYAPEGDPATPVPCPECGRQTEWLSEESYFFRLSAFQDRLLDLYEKNPRFIRPETRRNEIVSFVKGGLKDLSISRATLKWGIPLPDDPAHVFYVWFDALTGYMSAAGFKTDDAKFSALWPADLHLVGKDILRFHAVYWPAFLLAAGVEPPKSVFGHGWWLSKDVKMSKSRGNVLNPFVLNEVFGSELLRYYVLREMVFGQDCNFALEAIVQRFNSDLANDLGNLLSRTTAMISKYRAGRVPAPGEAKGDGDVRELAARVIQDYRKNFDEYSFSRALENVWELISRLNKYIVENEPWAIAGKPAEAKKLDSVLFHAAEALRLIAALVAPVIPKTAQALWEQLGLDGKVTRVRLSELGWSEELAGKTIRGGAALFPRLDPKEVMKKMDSASSSEQKTETPVPAAPAPAAATASTITIDDFSKVDLRVATVLEAERVKGADKLLRLVVDLGFEKRQIVAGIAMAYPPEPLVGRKVVIVANLLPRKLRGLESNGMIVAASVGAEDKPVLAGFLEDVPNGARLK
ncbi:MAG: methionine--tRNA ligase [Acidobacteria bacterium]|nr:methionine--tRNA ligase [Acidobacteriota bacterium]